MPRRFGVFVVITLVAILAVVPFNSLNCPRWEVWVTDEAGQPVAGITVRLSYQNYSAEGRGHEVDRRTDSTGHSGFPSDRLTASLVSRCFYFLQSARLGVHGSFGPHASVLAFGRGLEGNDVDFKKNILVDWTGEPDHMESRIVVRPCATPGFCGQ